MLLGGDRKGTRLNKPFREAVGEEEILELMGKMIRAWARERKEDEGFGDFTIRKGWIAATTHGTNFYEGALARSAMVAAMVLTMRCRHVPDDRDPSVTVRRNPFVMASCNQSL